MPAYDPNNILAKILRGEIPAIKVYEDQDTVAIMDIMPQADGHVLVIPRAPSRNLLDADPATFKALYETVQVIGRAVKDAFGAEGVLVQQFNEPAAGQTIFHLHVHVIPRRAGENLRAHTGKMADMALLARQAEMIKQALNSPQT
ncbi:HIT family protein [Aestuariivirga sp. YIM B02566]|uniref:HIT family protein n=1 Tax=Taklimakanibacter albus TaxID=2800327 RepID=A0ACC5R271_9HYPH|nr:HIT family protein [Aestuariivirga sp. YIM B02566]MBK1866729.1 HIT family protein [Aestuariivirga sp. YIM B02566]